MHGSTPQCLEGVRLILPCSFVLAAVCCYMSSPHAPTLTLVSLFLSLWCCIRTAASWPPGTYAWKSELCFGKKTAYRFTEISKASTVSASGLLFPANLFFTQ